MFSPDPLLTVFLIALLSTSAATGQGAPQATSKPEFPALPSLEELPEEFQREIEAAYRSARENPKDAERVGALGMLAHAHDLHSFAERCYRRARHLEPRELRWAYYLGEVLVRLGRHLEAAASFEKAVELYPEFGSAHYSLALLHRDQGHREQAREHMLVYQQHPRSRPPTDDPLLDAVRGLRTGAGAHLARGIRAESAGRLEAAIKEHLKALELAPDLTQARVNLIILYGRSGDHGKAEKQYRKLVDRNPDVADGPYNFGMVLMEQHRFEEAAEAFRRVLDINPTHALAHNNLGFPTEIGGSLEEAARHYRQALESHPGLRRARFNLGRILANQGRFQEAIEQIRRTLTPEDKETPNYLYGLAAAYVHSGNVDTGIRYARRAHEMALAMNQRDLAARIEESLQNLEEEIAR